MKILILSELIAKLKKNIAFYD